MATGDVAWTERVDSCLKAALQYCNTSNVIPASSDGRALVQALIGMSTDSKNDAAELLRRYLVSFQPHLVEALFVLWLETYKEDAKAFFDQVVAASIDELRALLEQAKSLLTDPEFTAEVDKMVPKRMCFFAALRSPTEAKEGFEERKHMDEDVKAMTTFLLEHGAIDFTQLVPCSGRYVNAATLSKECVFTALTMAASIVNVPDGTEVIIYYAGHGGKQGQWQLLHNEEIDLKDLTKVWMSTCGSKMMNLHIISDCCYSNSWLDSKLLADIVEKYPDIRLAVQGSSNDFCQGDVLAPYLAGTKKSIPREQFLNFAITDSYDWFAQQLPFVIRIGDETQDFWLAPRPKPKNMKDLKKHELLIGSQIDAISKTKIPLGFDQNNVNSFREFISGIEDTFVGFNIQPEAIAIQGSSVNAYSWNAKGRSGPGRLFGLHSDYDIGIVSEMLYKKYEGQGIANAPIKLTKDKNEARVGGKSNTLMVPELFPALTFANANSGPHEVSFFVFQNKTDVSGHTGRSLYCPWREFENRDWTGSKSDPRKYPG